MDGFSALGLAEDNFIKLNITLIHPFLTGKKLKAHTTIEFNRLLSEDLPPCIEHNEVFLTTEKTMRRFPHGPTPQPPLLGNIRYA